MAHPGRLIDVSLCHASFSYVQHLFPRISVSYAFSFKLVIIWSRKVNVPGIFSALLVFLPFCKAIASIQKKGKNVLPQKLVES